MEKQQSGLTLNSCNDWAKNLDAQSESIRQYVEEVTVPILGTLIDHDSHHPEEKEQFLGTGVLLELLNNYFVVTAGHCAEDCEKSSKRSYMRASAS